MKRFYSLAAALSLAAGAMMAQTLIVTDTDGAKHRFGVDRISQITFEEVPEAPAMTFNHITVKPYSGGNVGLDLYVEDGKVASGYVSLDMWGNTTATYLEAGTYTVASTNAPFTIDPKYSEANLGAGYLKPASGTAVVTDNDGVYTISVNLSLADGQKAIGTFTGELPNYTSHPKPYDITLDGAKIIDNGRRDPGEIYVKFNDKAWKYEMALDFYCGAGNTTLKAGTYTIDASDSKQPGTISYSASSIDSYMTGDSFNGKFTSGTVTVAETDGTYTINMDVTLNTGRKAIITYNGPIAADN